MGSSRPMRSVMVLPFIENNFGKYPYPQYSFIQGGDGGMEYPMATLIKGPSIGTVFHEWMHSWYQMMLGTNESLYPWMDEGFASYADSEVTAFYEAEMNKRTGKPTPNPSDIPYPVNHSGAYNSYYELVSSGLEEPLSTPADHFNTNYAYSIASYSKGEIFLEQLGYIVGDSVRDRIILEYYRLWRFKHPNVDDFLRVAENVSGMKLDWYKWYWVNSTKTIDYKIDSLWEENGLSNIRIKRVGLMPMPIDLELRFKDGSKEMHYIPLNLMFGLKPAENETKRIVHQEWAWTSPYYVVSFNAKLTELKEAEVDPSWRMADVQGKDNILQLKW